MANGMTGLEILPPIREPDVSLALQAGRLAADMSISPFLAQLLVARGIDTRERVEGFLSPRLSNLPSPREMADFDQAVERTAVAVIERQRVGVFGDYDVDGITSAAVVALFLEEMGVPLSVRIAHRDRGYGLKIEDVRYMLERGCGLFVVCDVGTSDFEALQFAKDNHLDVVVLDHHKVPEERPPALALVNPARTDCLFPDKNMASVGLSFYMVAALRTVLLEKDLGRPVPDPRSYLDLVALGTIADVAPLVGSNRIMVRKGLQLLSGSRRPGLQALSHVSGISDEIAGIGVREVAYRLAPRLNAAGRLGDAYPAFELLVVDDEKRALHLAQELDKTNHCRKEHQNKVLDAARQQVEWGEAGSDVLVVDGEGWHPGVVGIVAAKLTDIYRKPAVVISIEEDGTGRGSARSFGGINLYRCLDLVRESLISFGGHEAAAGLVVRRENIKQLRIQLDRVVREEMGKPGYETALCVDARIPLSAVNADLMDDIAKLEPLGAGNPAPTFIASGLKVLRSRVVGEDHLSLSLADGPSGPVFNAIGFGLGDRLAKPGEIVDIVFTPEWDQYVGNGAIRLRLQDIRPGGVKDSRSGV